MARPLENVRGSLFVLLLSIGVNGLLVWSLHRQPGEPITVVQPTPAPTATVVPTATPAPIVVHVSGAVVRPGVYEVPAGSRVADAIAAAGGFSDEAAPDTINQAASLHDGVQVHVPAEGEATPPPAGTNTEPAVEDTDTFDQGATADGRIDVNTAGAAELQELPGIGPTLSERIVEYRETNGPFPTVDALTNVSGIGESTLEEIRPHVTVGGQ